MEGLGIAYSFYHLWIGLELLIPVQAVLVKASEELTEDTLVTLENVDV